MNVILLLFFAIVGALATGLAYGIGKSGVSPNQVKYMDFLVNALQMHKNDLDRYQSGKLVDMRILTWKEVLELLDSKDPVWVQHCLNINIPKDIKTVPEAVERLQKKKRKTKFFDMNYCNFEVLPPENS